MVQERHTYTLAEVLAGGFEACCDLLNGTRYLWHGTEGIRVDPERGVSSWISDPSLLPEGDWLATDRGEAELAEMNMSAQPDRSQEEVEPSPGSEEYERVLTFIRGLRGVDSGASDAEEPPVRPDSGAADDAG